MKRAIETLARLRKIVKVRPLLAFKANLENRSPSGRDCGRSPPRLGSDEFGVQRACQAGGRFSSCMSKRSARGLSNRSAQR